VLEQLRDHGVIPVPVVETNTRACDRIACDLQHYLRHSLATRLLHNGASLAEIGELLRHRDLETTRIYAKVDQGALRALALPWPGDGA